MTVLQKKLLLTSMGLGGGFSFVASATLPKAPFGWVFGGLAVALIVFALMLGDHWFANKDKDETL